VPFPKIASSKNVITGKVSGARQTSANLRALAKQVSVPLNASSRFALQPTLKAARQNVLRLPLKETTGTLARSLTIKRNPRSSKVNPMHRVGPDAGIERETRFGKRKPVKYAHLVEFGTAGHMIGNRFHPGTRPQPFLEPAYFSTRDEVVKRFGGRIGPEMEKRAAKLGRKVTK
jgi:HK97 gp10 family phage protein